MSRICAGTMRPGWALAAALVGLLPALASAGDWTVEAGEDGNRVYSRSVSGERLREYRLVMKLDVAADALWAHLTDWDATPVSERILERRVISESGDEVVIYQKDNASPLKPRDHAMRKRTSRSGDTYRMTFELANDLAPAQEDGVVRVPAQRGSWTVRPDGDGSIAEFVIFYDPGGRVPDKLYNLGMPSNLLKMKAVLETHAGER